MDPWRGLTMEEQKMSQAIFSVSLAAARRMIAAGERKAAEMGIPYNIAVVDAGSNLVALVRMDGAWLGSLDIAINKAWTARAFDMPTAALAGLTQSGQSGFGLNTTNGCRVVIFGGGIPVKSNGAVIGAVGASGGSVEQDVLVAEAALSGIADER
jgi:uncharacterized protein GlcG (DUF336 family)